MTYLVIHSEIFWILLDYRIYFFYFCFFIYLTFRFFISRLKILSFFQLINFVAAFYLLEFVKLQLHFVFYWAQLCQNLFLDQLIKPAVTYHHLQQQILTICDDLSFQSMLNILFDSDSLSLILGLNMMQYLLNSRINLRFQIVKHIFLLLLGNSFIILYYKS